MTDPNDDPFQEPAWQAYADHVREKLVPMIEGSTVTMALVSGEVDVKQALEIGYMVMMDKPIIAAVTPGAKVPNKLALCADAIVEVNLDDPDDTARRVAEAIDGLDLDKPPNPLFNN